VRVTGEAISHLLLQFSLPGPQASEGFELLSVSNFGLFHRLCQELDAAIVGLPVHRIRMAIFAAVGKAVACRVSQAYRCLINQL